MIKQIILILICASQAQIGYAQSLNNKTSVSGEPTAIAQNVDKNWPNHVKDGFYTRRVGDAVNVYHVSDTSTNVDY